MYRIVARAILYKLTFIKEETISMLLKILLLVCILIASISGYLFNKSCMIKKGHHKGDIHQLNIVWIIYVIIQLAVFIFAFPNHIFLSYIKLITMLVILIILCGSLIAAINFTKYATPMPMIIVLIITGMLALFVFTIGQTIEDYTTEVVNVTEYHDTEETSEV